MRTALIVLTLGAVALVSLAAAYGDSATVHLHPGWNLVAWTTDSVAVEEITDGSAVAAVYGCPKDP